ncbi:WD40-repeat-containing domain protein [Limtongia smithiae]|uniref:WD40-repeat-containing domain protein n=1 Tax=Limtongia smithiae TaxID=1125753 RepID=UPI0034CD78C0
MTPHSTASLGRDLAADFFRLQKTVDYRASPSVQPRGPSGPLASQSASACEFVAYNALGNRIAAISREHVANMSATSSVIRIWNPERADAKYATVVRSGPQGGGHTGAVSCVAWDPTSSERLVSCSREDGMVRLWDVRLNRGLAAYRVTSFLSQGPTMVRYSPDGRWVFGIAEDRIIVLHRETLQPIAGFESGFDVLDKANSDGHVICARISFSSNVIAVGLSSGRVKFFHFDTSTGVIKVDSQDPSQPAPLAVIQAHVADITCLEFSPRGKYMAIGSEDSLVSIWDLHDLVCVRTISKISHRVSCVSFSFDGAFLAIAYGERDPIEIIHVDTGEDIYKIPQSFHFHVPSLEWHPSQYWLAYAGDPTGMKILCNTGNK